MEIIVGAASDKGNVKEINQDNFFIKIYEDATGDCAIFAMCDGMGGLTHGEVASSIAVKHFREWFEENYENILNKQSGEILSMMSIAISDINKKIIKYGQKMSSKVGTTASVLIIMGNRYYIVHVGDSRIYKVNKQLVQITKDHSFVAMSVLNKTMTSEEAKHSPRKNVLTQCVGVKEHIDPFATTGKVVENEFFILCCDGLYNKLEEKEMLGEIRKLRNIDSDVLQQCSEKCVNMVKDRGERDNISMIIVWISSEENFISKLKKYVGL